MLTYFRWDLGYDGVGWKKKPNNVNQPVRGVRPQLPSLLYSHIYIASSLTSVSLFIYFSGADFATVSQNWNYWPTGLIINPILLFILVEKTKLPYLMSLYWDGRIFAQNFFPRTVLFTEGASTHAFNWGCVKLQ